MDLERINTVIDRSGLKRATIYRDVAAGLFPPPVKIGSTAVWPHDEVSAINKARLAGKSDDEIRTLVADLKRQRTAIAA